MTRPITTAPADTARAMHAAEMRGQDMQDAQERILIAHMNPIVASRMNGLGDNPTIASRYDVEYTRTDLCITEAECQRRVDAAVQAEREIWMRACGVQVGFTIRGHIENAAAAIRARGQK